MAETIVLQREKETRNFVKYSSPEGQRVIANVYLPKRLAEGKDQLTVTVE